MINRWLRGCFDGGLGLATVCLACSALAQGLTVVPVVAGPGAMPVAAVMPDQLPHSVLARGGRDIAVAWLAAPTARYAHGVLGDALEAGALVVETRAGERLRFDLPPQRVFEDLALRLVDLDADGRDEIVLVESDLERGASLAVFGVVDGRLQRRAASPFIGRAHRWLNPLGAGDFDGDGRLDLAAVVTPHLGGILRLYRYAPPVLAAFAETRDVSTHAIGSTALAMGQVVDGEGRAWVLLPDQAHRRLRLLAWEGVWRERAAVDLPGRLVGALVAQGRDRWRGQTEGGEAFELRLAR
ncbi:MAG: VCBS repeat-containing protein [Rhodocyclaceae bacterium]|nr:VCBS repeat-containing protein [Rhodocyclaceae bacterium]